MHVGKCAHCAGSIKHSLPVTSAKAGPSSPQNDSDWPCDDSNKLQKILAKEEAIRYRQWMYDQAA